MNHLSPTFQGSNLVHESTLSAERHGRALATAKFDGRKKSTYFYSPDRFYRLQKFEGVYASINREATVRCITPRCTSAARTIGCPNQHIRQCLGLIFIEGLLILVPRILLPRQYRSEEAGTRTSAHLVCLYRSSGSVHVTWRDIDNCVLTFLNSDAHLRIVVEIGGGSEACGASTGKHRPLRTTERSSAEIICDEQTFCQRGHPRFHGIWEAFDQCTDSKYRGV